MKNDETLNTLAPSVDAAWRDDFVVELRLRGASGAAVADALMEAEAHCHESGQRAIDAFGPPAEHAKALDLPDESRWSGPQLVRTWARLLLLVGGWTLALWGGLALFLTQDERAEVSVGWLMSGGLILILMVMVFVMGERLLRLLIAHPVLSALGWGVAIVVVVAVGIPFEDIHLGSVPALVPLIVGVAALVAWVMFTVILRRSGKTLADPLVPPDMRHG